MVYVQQQQQSPSAHSLLAAARAALSHCCNVSLTMGTFITSNALKLVNSMALKHMLTGSHRLAVVKLKGSYEAYPILLPISTSTVPTMH